MNKTRIFSVLTVIFFILFSIESQAHKTYHENKNKKNIVKYAKGFSIVRHKNGDYTVTVYSPWEKETVLAKYHLVTGKAHKGEIHIPVKRAAVFSATQLNAFSKLGLLNNVVGVSDLRFLQNTKIKQLAKEGKISELSAGGNIFTEKILETNPGILFYSPYRSGFKLPVALKGILTVPFLDFMEVSPLGRAEWIKFTAVFFNKEKEADSIFSNITSFYFKFKRLADKVSSRPTVFSGKFFGGQWYVPGGKSYIAQLFADAGANYIWKNNSNTNSIPLDFETVYQKAGDADFWRIVGTMGIKDFYRNLASENPLYTQFYAFKKKHILYCNSEKTAYFETSALAPHLVLADFIKAFHPELLPYYKPVYYKVLH